jgi:archaeosine-15-forming tRNA-guanine transglycosylase
MSQKRDQLKRLKEVSELAFNSELTRLAEIKREEEPFRARLREIDQARSERAATLTAADGFDMASLMGADRIWDRWARQEKRKAMMALAKLAERRETQLERTRKAFGKKDALDRLAERDVSKR